MSTYSVVRTAQAAIGAGVTDTLVQYGALGVLVVILLGVVRVLYQDKARQHEHERQRADRLEALVLAQSEAMIDKIIPVLTAATEIMSDLIEQGRIERQIDAANARSSKRVSLERRP